MLMINGLVQEGEIAAMRYTEETLESWISPLSQTEEQRVVTKPNALWNCNAGCKQSYDT